MSPKPSSGRANLTRKSYVERNKRLKETKKQDALAKTKAIIKKGEISSKQAGSLIKEFKDLLKNHRKQMSKKEIKAIEGFIEALK